MYFETIAGDDELILEQEKKLICDDDESYLLALKLHEQFNGYSFESTNKDLKIIDPTSDVYHISIYHRFLDEVDHYRQHWWRCTGHCQNWKPFYGYVKRSMNRAPSKNDRWFNEHERRCNGQFIKIKEPYNETKLKINNHSLTEPPTKKVKILSIDQLKSDNFFVKPTAFIECHFCHENIHKDNLQLHIDIKCSMRV